MTPSREEAPFALALETLAEKRGAFLDAVCEGDTALRARLVKGSSRGSNTRQSASRRMRQGLHLFSDGLELAAPDEAKVVVGLQVQPKFRRGAEVETQPVLVAHLL